MSRKKVQHVGKILFSILSVLLGFLGILLFTSSRWMLATWAHLDMEELVYHLKAPLEGTSKDVLWSYVWSCGMISFAVLAIPMAQDNKKRDQNSKNGKRDHAAGPDVTPEHILAGTLKGCL